MPTGVSPSANSSRTTGTTRGAERRAWKSAAVVEPVAASDPVAEVIRGLPGRKVSGIGRCRADDGRELVAIEARAGAGVAGDTDLLHLHQQGIPIAVEGDALDVLHVS